MFFMVLGIVAIVLAWWFGPSQQVDVVVYGELRNSTRPMDFVMMLDASGSIEPADWDRQVLFASELSRHLSEFYADKAVPLRVAMGQFSTSARIDFPLSPEVEFRLSNLSSWTCPKTWIPGMPANPCEGMAEEMQCIEDAHCLVRRKGFTEMGAALCGGPRPYGGRTTFETCSGGAMGELWNAAPIAPLEPVQAKKCSDHSGDNPVKAVLLITDGKPMTPIPLAGDEPDLPIRGSLGTKDTVTAAKLIKSMSVTKIFGLFVGAPGATEDATKDAYGTLRALSSCCGAEQTEVRQDMQNSAQCTHAIQEDCPYSSFVQDWKALLENVEATFQELSLFTHHECTVTTTTTRTVPITSVFWLLLLPLPLLLSFIWGWSLLLCSRCCGYSVDGAREKKMRAGQQLEQGAATSFDVGPAANPQPFDAGRTEAPALLQSFGDMPVTSLGPDSPIEEGDDGAAGYKGRKWAPVRHSYIVGGKPMDVDYGQSTAAPPPMAPTRARRGAEKASLQDKPETAIHHMKLKAAYNTIRAAIAFRKAANLDEFAPLPVESIEAADNGDVPEVPEEPSESPLEKLISDIIVEPEELPRSLRALHCTMFFMLCVTLAMVPAVWYLSFPTFRPWEAIPWDSLEKKFEELVGNPHKKEY